jgi:hypothetical protein
VDFWTKLEHALESLCEFKISIAKYTKFVSYTIVQRFPSSPRQGYAAEYLKGHRRRITLTVDVASLAVLWVESTNCSRNIKPPVSSLRDIFVVSER